jgi:hypothetical protein
MRRPWPPRGCRAIGKKLGEINHRRAVSTSPWSERTAVGITTPYELDGPGIESRWERVFHTRPDRPWGPPSLCTMGTGSFQGVKRPGRGDDHPPSSSARVKERVELYLYSPFGPSWPVLGRTLPFTWSELEARYERDVRYSLRIWQSLC